LPKKKRKKKSWKEREKERPARQQKAQETYRIQRERERAKPREWPKGKILGTICLIAIVFVAYGAWQYHNSQLPPPIGNGGNNLPATGSAPNFSLRDIDGTQFSLNQFSGKVIAIHFMAVGCHGQIYPINDNQLTQLKTVCNAYCSSKPVTVVTVAVATCASSDLAQIQANYGITWVLGNDYADGKMDIVEAYNKYSIRDGTIVLIDKAFNVAEVYTDAITADTLPSKIDQLLGA